MNLDEVLRSVGRIQMEIPMPTAPGGRTRGWMTCFVIDENEGDRLVVTAGHFRQGSGKFEATFLKPRRTVGLDLNVQEFKDGLFWDVALLMYKDDPDSLNQVPPLRIAKDESVNVGDEAYIVGFPYSDVLMRYFHVSEPVAVVRKGIVAGKIPARNGNGAILILDVIWDVGMSGGPVIHVSSGNVIGVVSARPQIDSTQMEIVWSPSGDQILNVIQETK